MGDYMANGWGGVTPGGAMNTDLQAMTDAAQRARLSATKQNLQAATGGQGDATTRAHDKLAQVNATDAVKDVDPADVGAKINALDKRADDLEKEADKVQKSGTGNQDAMQMYIRAAATLRNQARQMHVQWMAGLAQQQQAQQQQAQQQQQQQAASQPAQQQYMPPPLPGAQ